MKISTSNLIATDKFLKLLRSKDRLTVYGEEMLSLVQNEIVRRANDSMAEYKFMAKYNQLKYYGKLPLKHGKKKAHKIMIPIRRPHKIIWGRKK